MSAKNHRVILRLPRLIDLAVVFGTIALLSKIVKGCRSSYAKVQTIFANVTVSL